MLINSYQFGLPVGAPSLMGTARKVQSTSTSLTMTAPTDTGSGSFVPAAGDLLVACFSHSSGSHTSIASSSGAAKAIGAGSAGSSSIWYKVLGASETSWDWTFPSAIPVCLAYFLRSSNGVGTWTLGAQNSNTTALAIQITTGTTGTLHPNAAVVACKGSSSASSGYGIDSGFTLHPQQQNVRGAAGLLLPGATTTAVNPEFSWTGSASAAATVQEFYLT